MTPSKTTDRSEQKQEEMHGGILWLESHTSYDMFIIDAKATKAWQRAKQGKTRPDHTRSDKPDQSRRIIVRVEFGCWDVSTATQPKISAGPPEKNQPKQGELHGNPIQSRNNEDATTNLCSANRETRGNRQRDQEFQKSARTTPVVLLLRLLILPVQWPNLTSNYLSTSLIFRKSLLDEYLATPCQRKNLHKVSIRDAYPSPHFAVTNPKVKPGKMKF